MVAKYNWSKHIQTEKHFKKQHLMNNPEQPYVRERLIKDDKNNEDIIDPLTVKEEDIVDIEFSDSEDEIGEVMKEIMEIEKSDNDEKPKNKIKKSTKKFEIS